MQTRICILLFMLPMAALPPAAYPAADYLDAEPLFLNRSGPAGPVTEGQTVAFTCGWKVRIVDSGQYWNTKNGETWPVRVEVDGKTIGNFQGKIAAGTCLGQFKTQSGIPIPGGGYSSSSKNCGASIEGSSGPANWVAAGSGKHQVRCVLNQPKAISDRNPGNNTLLLAVDVTPVALSSVAKSLKGKPGPKALASPSQPQVACPPYLDAWLDPYPGSLPAKDLASAPQKKKVSLPLTGSTPLLNNSVQCGYTLGSGQGAVNMSYLLKCEQPVKQVGKPHAYWCKEPGSGRAM